MSTKKKFKGRVVCTKAQFNALAEKDPQKEYLVTDEEVDYASLTEQNDFTGINNFNAETNFNEEANVDNHNINIHNGYLSTTDENKDLVTKYSADEVVIENGTGGDAKIYNLKLPLKSGTLATTDDVPEVDIDNETITKNTGNKLQTIGVKYNDNLITAEMLYNTTHFIRYKDAPSFSRTFSENSFATISQISKNEISNMTETGDDLYTAVETKYGWKVGDTIQYTIASGDNAGTYTAQIWDFNNAVDKDGNKNGILLGNVELLTTLAKMNDTDTNKGGFGASAMATTTLPAVYETLPDDLKNVIRETKVTYHSGSDDPDTELSGYYKLYLPSEYEMFGIAAFYALQEGQYLTYWQTHNTDKDREKTQLGQSSSHWYWLRSAFRSGAEGFAIVIETGSLFRTYARSLGGVCLMFSI